MAELKASSLTKVQRRRFAKWLGQRSYEARLARFGLERIREIARQNGRKGGRPRIGASS